MTKRPSWVDIFTGLLGKMYEGEWVDDNVNGVYQDIPASSFAYEES